MLKSIFFNFNDEEMKKRREKQNNWRQKQLDIFYRTGKPIFNMTVETQYIRSNNNPPHFIEKKCWEP